jgi:hypothetical protein
MKEIMFVLLAFCTSIVIVSCGPKASNNNEVNNGNKQIQESAKTFVEDPEVRKALGILAEYERTDEAIARNIREADGSIKYAHLKKNAAKYIGKPWICTGRILEIFEKDGETTARVGLGGYGVDPIWVYGKFPTDFIENDRVSVVGYLNGDHSYVSQAGWNITIPSMVARTMLKPSEVSKLREQARRGHE